MSSVPGGPQLEPSSSAVAVRASLAPGSPRPEPSSTGLGVLNAAEFPAVERVPDDDIREPEKLIIRAGRRRRHRAGVEGRAARPS